MRKVRIVTDNTADIPHCLLEELGITVISSYVVIGDKVYREGIDIEPKEIYKRMMETDIIPKTSQPSLADFKELYGDLSSDGSSIVSIHMSSNMSGTTHTALAAKNLLPDRDITVIDSKLMSLSLGLVVMAAAREAQDGKTKEEVIAKARYVMEKVQTFFIVDDLAYLQRGGRIGKASALVGTILNIKPVLYLHDGFITPFEKTRGETKAINRIIEIAQEYETRNGIEVWGISHANCFEKALQFKERVKSVIKNHEPIMSDICATIGVHCGPGTMALFFY